MSQIGHLTNCSQMISLAFFNRSLCSLALASSDFLSHSYKKIKSETIANCSRRGYEGKKEQIDPLDGIELPNEVTKEVFENQIDLEDELCNPTLEHYEEQEKEAETLETEAETQSVVIETHAFIHFL